MASPRTSRRSAALLVSGGLVVLLLAAAWVLPVPYVTLAPGPTENTLGRVGGRPIVEVDARTYRTRGALDLTTVAVTSPGQRLQLLGALGGWLDPHVAVVPRSYIYPPDASPEQVEQRNAEEMSGSQEAAVAAAEREVGLHVTEHVVIHSVVEGSPAQGRLHAGDRVVAVDGTRVDSPDEVVRLVRRHHPGDRIEFAVRRAGRSRSVEVTAAPTPGQDDQAMVGVEVAVGFDLPVEVSVNLGQDIGGPSAGTMFALAIVDKLTPGALTGGRHVAGTGTIEPSGEVGPIGGIQQKVAGARAGGATIFLTPAANCAAAADAGVDGIRLVRVTTLHSAVEALRTLAKEPDPRVASGHDAVPGCRS